MEENGELRQKRASYGWMDGWMVGQANKRRNGQVDKWMVVG